MKRGGIGAVNEAESGRFSSSETGASPLRRVCSFLVTIFMLAGLVQVVVPRPAAAVPASLGGYLHPTDNTTVTRGGGFLDQGPGCPNPSGYLSGQKHLGVDFSRPVGAPVYAIADGVVDTVGSSNWDGQGNSALGIRHTNADGSTFVALYGHIKHSLSKGATVRRGQSIGTIGSYPPGGSHLHFGINPGKFPLNGQGSMPCTEAGSRDFVNPIQYLQNRSPKGHNPAPAPNPATSQFNPCTFRGWVVGANGTPAKYLVQENCRRAHIPTGGDYQSIVANLGSNRVRIFASVAEMNRIPDSGRTVQTRRVGQPAISGPSKWIRYVTGVGDRAVNGDYHWTTHAAGRPLTNEGRWDIGVRAPGVYRVKCFIPNRRDAYASVIYRVHDGGSQAFTKAIRQASHIGWTHLGDLNVKSGTVRIVLRDNEGTGPYAERFAYDACEAVPIR